MANNPDPEPSADGQLLVTCLASDSPDRKALFEQLCAGHPDRASSLRQLYGLLDEFGLLEEPETADPNDTSPRAALPEQIGPYRVLDLLGAGGMGVVYRAQHRQLGRVVALKVIHGPLAHNDRARARFRREAALAARLDDPRICPIYEFGEADCGTPFLAMRPVPGVTLAQALASSRIERRTLVALPPIGGGTNQLASILQFVEQTAAALHVAHEKGLVHRDVKPGNLMITPDGTPVLLDFGLAASNGVNGDDGDDSTKLTGTGDQLGTPHYMAPEQITGGGVDRRTDVYALGVVLYECLTGKTPFDATRRHDLAAQIVAADPPDPRPRQRAVGRDLWTVLQTALARDPARRYATAAAFAEDLRRVRCREPILARRPNVLRRLVQFARRHPFAAMLLMVLTVAVGVFSLLIQQRDATARALRATANARTAPAAALADVLGAVRSHRTLENLSALQEIAVAHHERMRLLHSGATWAVLWTDDGQRVVTVSDDGFGRVFDRGGATLARIPHDLRPGYGAMAVNWLERSPAIPGQAERFVTAAMDGSARVIDRDGRVLQLLDHRTEHNQKGGSGGGLNFLDPGAYPLLTQARWSSDGLRIATACSDRIVRVWEAATGRKLCELPGHVTPFVRLAWSSTGLLASADGLANWNVGPVDGVLRIWQVHGDGYTETSCLPLPDLIDALDWAPDGSALVGACRDGCAYVWTPGENAPLRLPHVGPVWSALFSPDGQQILTGSLDQTVRSWRRDGTPLRVGRHDAGVTEVAFAGGDERSGPLRILSTSLDQTVRVWDHELNPQFVLRGHRDLTIHASMSPDGRQVATASWDGSVRLWDLVDDDTPRLVGHTARVRDLAVLRDGRVVSVADDRTVRIWDLASGRARVFDLPMQPWNLDVTPDGSTMVIGGEDGVARTYDLATGLPRATYQDTRTQWAVARLLGDGRVAAGVRDRLRVFDADQVQTWAANCRAIYALSFAPHRNVLAAAGRDVDVRLWTGAGETLPGPVLPENQWARAIAWSPAEDRLAVGSGQGGELWLWTVPANPGAAWPQPVRLVGTDGAIHDIAWSPSGRLLAAAVGDGSVHLWDAASETRLMILRGHGNAAVQAVAFANEDLLLSGGADGAIQCWATSGDRQVRLATARLPAVFVAAGSAREWQFLLATGRFEEAWLLGRRILEDQDVLHNAKTLQWFAMEILKAMDGKQMPHPGLLELAERAARLSIERATPPDEWMLATMARLWLVKGDLPQAVAWQTRAVESTPVWRSGDRQTLEAILARYRGMPQVPR